MAPASVAGVLICNVPHAAIFLPTLSLRCLLQRQSKKGKRQRSDEQLSQRDLQLAGLLYLMSLLANHEVRGESTAHAQQFYELLKVTITWICLFQLCTDHPFHALDAYLQPRTTTRTHSAGECRSAACRRCRCSGRWWITSWTPSSTSA